LNKKTGQVQLILLVVKNTLYNKQKDNQKKTIEKLQEEVKIVKNKVLL